ncbi:MAG: helix-turn-helix domain-containing protein [Clostridiales bacterium]|nr:helix-turn-helix domain-containing protein [Clostridiales bacterium]
MENSFGSFLSQKRKEKKLTQKELSKLLFVSESTISKWEKDVAHPDITLLPKLSAILGVSEHELITASIDNKAREEKKQAKKWRTFSLSWSLFFYIAYGIALIPCFICDLAINKTLSWFWIVLSALILAFTFTNLPKIIKRYKLIFIPLSQYLALVLLFGVCCIYNDGNWFWIATLSVLLGLTTIFTPIYIAKYKVFSKIKKCNDFVSVAVDFLMLNILLIVINAYALTSGYANGWWYFKIALPIVLCVYLALNIIMSVRFLKTNRFLKTSVILLLSNAFLYLLPLFIKVKNPEIQKEIDQINIFKANLFSWQIGVTLEQNIHLIICLTLLFLALVFLTVGLIRHFRRKNKCK